MRNEEYIHQLLNQKLGEVTLSEIVSYPNGGKSYFYIKDNMAIIIDQNICDRIDDTIFSYRLLTNKQNEYMAKYNRVYRLMDQDLERTLDFYRR